MSALAPRQAGQTATKQADAGLVPPNQHNPDPPLFTCRGNVHSSLQKLSPSTNPAVLVSNEARAKL
eukprot:scaffold136450_cov15-Prasinocladus_malaysianus.AAC.1